MVIASVRACVVVVLLSVTLAVVLLETEAAQENNWAVLVAGSSSYYNYRHQADICHAFQVLTDPTKGNFNKENVIVFMYDDIATDPSNPYPGNLINHPNGPNVYPGVNKDYTGDAVNPQNFLAVLAGNQSGVTGGNGKVLKSDENSNVFIYFSDHGATGLIAFPNDYLYANDLMNTLQYMNKAKMYNQLVFYLEACESGSMFSGLLPANINIYATTAATPDQSSYACYYDDTRGTYLGDEYSVRWMEDSDTHDNATSTWTLKQQFKLLQQEVVQSQPQQYGNLTIAQEDVENFQGYDEEHTISTQSEKTPSAITPCGGSDSRDVKLNTLLNRRALAKSDDDYIQIDLMVQEELAERAQADVVIDRMLESVVGGSLKNQFKSTRRPPRNFDCLRSAVQGMEESCGRFTDYSLKWVYVLVNLCEEGYDAETIVLASQQACDYVLF